MCDIETLSIDRVLNKKHFYGDIMQKMFYFGKQLKAAIPCNKFF